jgi:RimJ/RimL family protein N-acetyltransferase
LGDTTLADDGDVLSLAAERREDGRLIGDVALWLRSAQHRQGEIGVILHPDAHGRGYAGEAAVALLDVAFDRVGMHRVVGRLNAGNAASAALMRRLGMRQEGHLRHNERFKAGWNEELIFAVLETEWRARRA